MTVFLHWILFFKPSVVAQKSSVKTFPSNSIDPVTECSINGPDKTSYKPLLLGQPAIQDGLRGPGRNAASASNTFLVVIAHPQASGILDGDD
eukprot:CAMPEP_0194141898 /NCGR_PEP_ID=MMETSP0152-20130528/11255_1 /TAXON_ID=1049557 /ORGANISM="Thalassiothrix antarctica, Strain L6-D1" /LENGTH=91 /DNA_ID=CAMNT_0038840673 /DNA_START=279 /DNA_END=550 /DNA_ORIENTATION=-